MICFNLQKCIFVELQVCSVKITYKLEGPMKEGGGGSASRQSQLVISKGWNRDGTFCFITSILYSNIYQNFQSFIRKGKGRSAKFLKAPFLHFQSYSLKISCLWLQRKISFYFASSLCIKIFLFVSWEEGVQKVWGRENLDDYLFIVTRKKQI